MNERSDDLSPVLTAMMCDGMGWFGELDYKRMLLVYDRILYLLPRHLVPFPDVTGERRELAFPVALRESHFCDIHHLDIDDPVRELLLAAATADLADERIIDVIGTIPVSEKIYTWRVVNADADYSKSERSLELTLDEQARAHTLLLNKFLLAADDAGSVPITGKPYIHSLIGAKYRRSVDNLRQEMPNELPTALRATDLRHDAVVGRLVEALVADEELEARSMADIVRFKDRHRDLFERFSLSMRRFVTKIQTLPGDRGFERDVEDLLRTDVWEEQQAIRDEIRGAWRSVFKSAVTESLGSNALKSAAAVTFGVVPWLSLRAVTLATVIASSVPIAGWATTQLMELLGAKRGVRKHGLYYLLHFGDA